jgi:xyloglucan-specific exo-beta-1,4-glucanase
MGDVGGFVHTSLDSPPAKVHTAQTLTDIDYAGNSPSNVVVVGNQQGSLMTSTDGGNSWTSFSGTHPTNGKITYSANATSILFSGDTVQVSTNGGAFVTVSSLPASSAVEFDKINDSYVSYVSLQTP